MRIRSLGAIALALAGCGDDSDVIGEGAGGASSAATSDSASSASVSSVASSADASSSAVQASSAASSGAGGSGGPASPRGSVHLSLGGEDGGVSGSAQFIDAGNEPACSEVAVAGCILRRCALDSSPILSSAGEITISAGGVEGAPDFTLAQDDSGEYFGDSAWGFDASGVPIRVVATGDDVPPFDLAGLLPDDPMDLHYPLPTTFSVDEDYVITWSGAGDAVVRLELSARDEQIVETVICEGPQSDLRAVIPAAALAAKSVRQGDQVLRLTGERQLQGTFGDWDVTFRIGGGGVVQVVTLAN